RAAAADAVDGAARVYRGAGRVEPAQRRPVAAHPRIGPEQQLLIELVRAAREIAADEARVLALGLARSAHGAGPHERGEARREALELGLETIGDVLVGERVAARHVAVDVERVTA